MSETFYRVDLHVHTPASKCYTGDKTENGYWEIIRSAVNNNVRMIAITDHNTLEGYEKLIELREKTYQEFGFIQKYTIPEEEKAALKEKVKLLKSVSIIMGVEITLNPGVHIIVLCDEADKQNVDSLLNDIGYSSERRGCDNDFVPDMDVKTFLADERLSNKIILAPHVDSGKGIWNVLEGTYRAAIFKSNTIAAITCNNSQQLNKIRELTKNDPGYKRTTPFVCINASDAHKQSSIGEKHSYFKLTEFTFSDLKKVFDEPEEYISDTETQDFIDYVKKCVEYKPTIYLNNTTDLEKACYAILNQGSGCILLGITRNYEQNGIQTEYEKIENEIISTFSDIQEKNNSRYVSYRMKLERLGNGKIVGIIIAGSDESRLWIDNSEVIYNYCEENGYKAAGIREIEGIIRERIITELQDFEERNNDSIWDAMVKMRHVLNPVSKYVLYDKFKSNSVPITYYFNIEPITKENNLPEGIAVPENGMEQGNVYYTRTYSPRLEDSFLRYSCPVYKNDDKEYLQSLFEIKSPVIVVTLGGGCHIIDSEESCYFECQTPAVLLIPNDRFNKSQLSLYHVIAWLKTDCFIWTCIQKKNDVNLFSPRVLLDCFIPYKKEYYELEKIEEEVRKILSLEKDFLRQSQDYPTKDNELNESINNLCDKHNKTVTRISSEIERIIKEFFEITDDENDMINNDLVDTEIYQPNMQMQENDSKETELICV